MTNRAGLPLGWVALCARLLLDLTLVAARFGQPVDWPPDPVDGSPYRLEVAFDHQRTVRSGGTWAAWKLTNGSGEDVSLDVCHRGTKAHVHIEILDSRGRVLNSYCDAMKISVDRPTTRMLLPAGGSCSGSVDLNEALEFGHSAHLLPPEKHIGTHWARLRFRCGEVEARSKAIRFRCDRRFDPGPGLVGP